MPWSLTTWEGGGLICTLALSIHLISYYISAQTPLPPGPKGLPVLGNVLQIRKEPWNKFMKWTKEYGPIFRIQNVIVIGTHEVASDLLDHRAAIYSDRPRSIVASELLTGGLVFALGQHNDVWRRMRRASHEALNNQVSKRYHHLQERESAYLLHQLLDDPSHLKDHLKRANGSLLVSVLYGYQPIVDSLDEVVQKVNAVAERVLTAAAPGAYLVEYMPWMMKLPRWMCKWRRDAEREYTAYSELFMSLLEDVETRLTDGNHTSSVAENIIQNPHNGDLSRLERSWLLGTLYAAGSETTTKQMLWFFVSMILHPEVQKKAQFEIDQVVGRGRLPTFKDYDNLPYVRAIIKEVNRWRGLAVIGVPHRSSKDDVYHGYFIPKGTVCIYNTWGMHLDKTVYGDDADVFKPERQLEEKWLRESEGHVNFGFGRRICVGKHLANNSMFIQAARILWAFNLSSDNPPNPDKYIHDGLVLRPELFECTITVRFPEVKEILANAVEVEFAVNS